MTMIELTPNTIDATVLSALQGQPMHRTYTALGWPSCPDCGEHMRGVGFAHWGDLTRSQWRCTNRLDCHAAQDEITFCLTTNVVAS